MCVLLFLSHFPYNIYVQEEGIILTCRNTYLICTVRRTCTEVCSVYVSRLLVDCSLLVFSFQMTSSGAPFWSGPKRCPHPIEFDADNVSGFMSASASSVAAIFCACPFLCHQQSNFLCLPFPMSSAEQFSMPALSYVISRAIFYACPFLCHQQSNFLCLPFPMSSAEQFSVPALSCVLQLLFVFLQGFSCCCQ